MDDNTRTQLTGQVRTVEELTADDIAEVRLHLNNSVVGYPCTITRLEPSLVGRYTTVLDFRTNNSFAGPRVPPEEVLGATLLNFGRYEQELRIRLVSGETLVRRLPVFVVRGFNPPDDTDGDGNPDYEGNLPSPIDPVLLFENALL